MVVEAIIALDRFPGHSHGRLNSAIRQGFSSGAGDGTADRGLGGKVAESKGSQQNGSVGGNTGQPKSKAAPSTGGIMQAFSRQTAASKSADTTDSGDTSVSDKRLIADSDKPNDTQARRTKAKTTSAPDVISNKRRKKDAATPDAMQSSPLHPPSIPPTDKQNCSSETTESEGRSLDAFMYEEGTRHDSAVVGLYGGEAAGSVCDEPHVKSSSVALADMKVSEGTTTPNGLAEPDADVDMTEAVIQQEDELFLSDKEDDRPKGDAARKQAVAPRRTTLKKKVMQERTYLEGNAIVFEDVETIVEAPVDAAPPKAAVRIPAAPRKDQQSSKKSTSSANQKITSFFRPKPS
eukprot:GHVS01097922.1.p1 GENE.GHVS01097922.1~~GHVS01097922.1.p1  ORF type:complete len:349 (+),score=68.70 GHVS01097922.1:349-1395(+)